jgi:hypothetical protein
LGLTERFPRNSVNFLKSSEDCLREGDTSAL